MIYDLHKPEAKRAVAEGRAVKIDRSTEFGNPFYPKDHSDEARVACVAKFRAWFYKPEQKAFREMVGELLRDVDFACWCRAGQMCHGRVYEDFFIQLRDNPPS